MAEGQTPVRSLRVLVAEDNPVNQRVAMGLISRLGHTVTLSGDGAAAVEAARDGDFDLIFMDIHMPVMDGREATQHIRALPNGKGDIPIIAMTAKALSGDREDCLSAGMDDYLSKPVHRDVLAACLARWASGRPKLNECRGTGATDKAIPLFEPEIVRELKAVIGEKGFADLMRTLIETAHGQLDAIEAAVASEKAEVAARITTSLRGAAANMGLSRLAEAAGRIEAELAAGGNGTTEKALSAAIAKARELVNIYAAQNR